MLIKQDKRKSMFVGYWIRYLEEKEKLLILVKEETNCSDNNHE
jgi:hypothetical protein